MWSSTHIKLLFNSQLCAANHSHGTVSRIFGPAWNSRMKAEWFLFAASVCTNSTSHTKYQVPPHKGSYCIAA